MASEVLTSLSKGVQIVVLTLTLFVFLVFVAGIARVGMNKKNGIERFESTEIVRQADRCNANPHEQADDLSSPVDRSNVDKPYPTSLSTDIYFKDGKCTNTVDPHRPYAPNLYEIPQVLLENTSVYVDSAESGWRPAYITKVDSENDTFSATFTDDSQLANKANNIKRDNIKRYPTSSEIEACAIACGSKGKLSVGNCPINGGLCECKCGLSDLYGECEPEDQMTWNTYKTNCSAVALQNTSRQFGMNTPADAPILTSTDQAGSGQGGAGSASAQCGAVADSCKSQCDQLADPEARKLCKNPSMLFEKASYVTEPRRVSSNTLCNYQLSKLTRDALKCPAKLAEPKACWQLDSQGACQLNKQCEWKSKRCKKKTTIIENNKCASLNTIAVIQQDDDDDHNDIPRLFDVELPDIDKLTATLSNQDSSKYTSNAEDIVLNAFGETQSQPVDL